MIPAHQPAERWQELEVKDGQKGPIRVRAILTKVRTRQDRRLGPEEWLLAIRTPHPEAGQAEISYHLAWSPQAPTLAAAVAAQGHRHQIEQLFEHGKGEAGLAHYEVRSYVGWHHHMTLSLLALWFLCLERLSQGKKRRP